MRKRPLFRHLIVLLLLVAAAAYAYVSNATTYAQQGEDRTQLDIQISPESGPFGTTVAITGSGAPPGASVRVLYAQFNDLERCRVGRDASVVADVTADAQGRFRAIHTAEKRRDDWAGITYLANIQSPDPARRASSNLECFTFTSVSEPQSRLFPETSHRVSGEFLDLWDRSGGLPIFGYPLTARIQERGLTVQYFERAIFELHPENQPPQNVLLRRLGWIVSEELHGQPPFQQAEPIQAPGCRYFPETGHNLCAGFRSYWQDFGGLRVYGYPISEEFRQASEDGKTYIVQYFERQRFEWHPGEWPQRHDVLLSRLGARLLDGAGGLMPPPPGPGAQIEIPAQDARVTLPVHILARLEKPDMQIVARLRWQDGTVLTNTFTTLRAPDGSGLLIDNLDWMREGRPPMPGSQPATLELVGPQGSVLAQRGVSFLSDDDHNTDRVSVFWLLGDPQNMRLEEVQRAVPKTAAVGTAALEELLWGPAPPNLAGFQTAIPTPREVLNFPGRTADWGVRVTLLDLRIENGVATANFSKELRAYGGGSARVQAIREQITRTLTQFDTVDQVRIAIEGETEGVLQP